MQIQEPTRKLKRHIISRKFYKHYICCHISCIRVIKIQNDKMYNDFFVK